MNIKVSLFDKGLWSSFLSKLSIISVLLSFVLIAVTIPEKHQTIVGIILFVILLIIYFIMWIKANRLNKATLHINNSTVHVKIGDIFEEDDKDKLKVMAFNEYFDTRVDDKIIAKRSLNGMYINKKVENVNELDRSIETDQELNEKIVSIDDSRKNGKQKRYKLGTIFKDDDYLLTAFSRFDKDNKAYLYMNDYINFLINFWNEVDIVYAGRTVVIPLLGSGMTRFKEYNMVSEQELLELLIWSFKVSRIKFKHPAHVLIVVHESTQHKINFYKLRRVEHGL